MTNLESLVRAFLKGEVLACVGIADELEEQGHPLADKAGEYSVTITTSRKWSEVFLAVGGMAETVCKELYPRLMPSNTRLLDVIEKATTKE